MAAPDTHASARYRGRFAPSPTGPLHAGSILTALASYLDARAQRGEWLVRIEDLDPPRESKAAVSEILRALEALGLTWDGAVQFQSQRLAVYAEALQQLHAQGLVYACECSRQHLAAANTSVYPGYCRKLHLAWDSNRALRCRVLPATLGCTDRLQGWFAQDLERDAGDFVIRRRDSLFAYQLAVVVDDAWQGITDVVRGMDLLDSTPRQICLQRHLLLPTPRYAHVPVVTNAEGQKLSKQHHAKPVDSKRAPAVLLEALRRLRQNPDAALAGAPPEAILAWASDHWNPAALRSLRQIPEIEGSAAPAV